MRVAWATDVHLDFLSDEKVDAFVDRIAALEPEALLLTGDISNALRLDEHLRRVSTRLGRPIYFVLGNHDFYGGAIDPVRALARALPAPALTWLAEAGVVALTRRCALVGQDGWGDGRLGNFERSTVLLNDWSSIRDFAALGAMFDVPARLARVRALADASARALAPDLTRALAEYEEVIVLTHVPPFAEACWHEGATSDPDWLPWFTCKAVGDVILAEADRQPRRRLRVLCGHTHSGGRYRPRPHVEVLTGPAAYGQPSVTMLEL